MVEVAGFGVCNEGGNPFPVLVICVQQENFQAWTVYRRYNQFIILSDQLREPYPSIPTLPYFNELILSNDNLESCRESLNKWIQVAASDSNVLRTQSMYQFLCVDANMPPPYLEVHWRHSSNGSFEEMDMDDMFDGADAMTHPKPSK